MILNTINEFHGRGNHGHTKSIGTTVVVNKMYPIAE